MQKTKPIKIINQTNVIETNNNNLESDLNRIQNTSHDDFFNREVNNGADERNVGTTTTTTTTSTDIQAEPIIPEHVNMQASENTATILHNYQNRPRISLDNIRHLPTRRPTAPQEIPIPPQEEPIDPVIPDLERIRQNANVRVEEHQQAFDVFTEIGNNLRVLQLNTRELINTTILWSLNHPVLAIGTFSAIAGVTIMLFRGRSAMALGRTLLDTGSVPGLTGIFDNLQNRNAAPENVIGRRNMQNLFTSVYQLGGILYMCHVVIKGLRHL